MNLVEALVGKTIRGFETRHHKEGGEMCALILEVYDGPKVEITANADCQSNHVLSPELVAWIEVEVKE